MVIKRNVMADWSSPVEQRITFKTDVFRAEDGTETRTAMRVHPRYRYDFQMKTLSGKNAGEQFLQARNHGALQVIPDPVEFWEVQVTGGSFAIPTTVPWLRATDDLYFREYGFTQVLIVVANVVTVNPAPPDGRYIVHRTRVGRNSSDTSASLLAASIGQSKVSFAADPPTRSTDSPEITEPTVTYRTYPLFDFEVNWRTDPEGTISHEARGLDTSYGQPFTRQVGQIMHESTWQVTAFNREKMREFVNCFLWARGRHAPFYAPAALPEIKLLAPAVEGQTTIVAALPPEYLAVWDQQILRNFILRGSNGTQPVGIAEITTPPLAPGVQDQPFAGGALIQLDGPISAAGAGATHMGWLVKSRFSNDELRVRWITDQVAEATFSTTALIDSFHEIRISDFRIMFNGAFVVFPAHEFDVPQGQISDEWSDAN